MARELTQEDREVAAKLKEACGGVWACAECTIAGGNSYIRLEVPRDRNAWLWSEGISKEGSPYAWSEKAFKRFITKHRLGDSMKFEIDYGKGEQGSFPKAKLVIRGSHAKEMVERLAGDLKAPFQKLVRDMWLEANPRDTIPAEFFIPYLKDGQQSGDLFGDNDQALLELLEQEPEFEESETRNCRDSKKPYWRRQKLIEDLGKQETKYFSHPAANRHKTTKDFLAATVQEAKTNPKAKRALAILGEDDPIFGPFITKLAAADKAGGQSRERPDTKVRKPVREGAKKVEPENGVEAAIHQLNVLSARVTRSSRGHHK